MEIQEIYARFAAKMTQIELHQRTADFNAQDELGRLHQREEDIEKHWPQFKILPASAHNMFFHHAVTGRQCLFGGAAYTMEQLKENVDTRRNKLYQWLLVEAYEEFEDMLKSLYAFCGKRDPNFWPLANFGNIKISEIEGRNYDWYLERAREKKHTPESILNHLRAGFPKLAKYEKKNELDVDFRLTVALIQELRHRIVHKGGAVRDVEEFVGKIFSSTGLSKQGEKGADTKAVIEQYVREIDSVKSICLIQPKRYANYPERYALTGFDILFRYLISYANLICEIVGLRETYFADY